MATDAEAGRRSSGRRRAAGRAAARRRSAEGGGSCCKRRAGEKEGGGEAKEKHRFARIRERPGLAEQGRCSNRPVIGQMAPLTTPIQRLAG